ncbi:conserved hypothetical protein [Candidatus Brocadia pituitae]|nr:conserved hypothetical protein [Candidatus Brocadia pituitae]
MYVLLELYAQLYRKEELVICVDEKSKQFLQQTRTPIAAKSGAPINEYQCAGTHNI